MMTASRPRARFRHTVARGLVPEFVRELVDVMNPAYARGPRIRRENRAVSRRPCALTREKEGAHPGWPGVCPAVDSGSVLAQGGQRGVGVDVGAQFARDHRED